MEEADYEEQQITGPIEIPNKLNIFGVSRMSTSEIQSFFCTLFSNPELPVKIEWINDDSCNAVFEQEDFVLLALSVGEIVVDNPNEKSLTVPPTVEGGEPTFLTIRRSTDDDI